jgi:hypothetical protein
MTTSSLRADGLLETLFTLPAPEPNVSTVALRVELSHGSFAGDALPEPGRFVCASGSASLGDWSLLGLSTYSGAAWYRRSLTLDAADAARGKTLDLGHVSATAALRINGHPAGILLCPPWQIDVAGLFREGENQIEIHVANTLANHYSVGIPSPYAMENQTVSGLLGPVTLRLQHASTGVLLPSIPIFPPTTSS